MTSALAECRRRQQESGDYIRASRNYPEWLGDTEGAKRGAEDNLMEEALIVLTEPAEPSWFPGTLGTHFAGLPLRYEQS